MNIDERNGEAAQSQNSTGTRSKNLISISKLNARGHNTAPEVHYTDSNSN